MLTDLTAQCCMAAAAAAAASAGMRVDTRQASAEALPGLTSALNSGRSRVSGWV